MPRLSLNSKLVILISLTFVSCFVYEFILINLNYWEFALSIRTPKLAAMFIAAVCIGGSSLIFQTLVNNKIITPCLLGMNSLYLTIHTLLVLFFGLSSFVTTNKNLAFVFDLVVMCITAAAIYGWIFKKTGTNVLYVLLIGTVLATLFNSISQTAVRAMDPNDYDALLTSLTATVSNVNSSILTLSGVICLVIAVYLLPYVKILDVMALGRNCAVDLGIDYEKTLRRMLIIVCILIATATALVGPLSFMGLITTNISRQLFKTGKHFYLISGSILVSVITLTAGQIIIEHVLVYSVPISVFITLGGGAYFLYLILKDTK